ncbi:lysophospholipid acyltransferase family protein [Levilactobacillus fujinensis]|uniref:Lysophospholipid acyltransferase family protein n=1 Tax=Levilactobacillus fujinensis TaxID=2486024 RepID=A0ABW1TID4_9LACO|nr:1-acyl-sn-glycerol-3-phosphate acyltransferase [Levilactobacillus fujinensis]
MRKISYRTLQDDVVTSHEQEYRLSLDFDWQVSGKLWQRRIVRLLAKTISVVYCHWTVTFKNAWRLKASGQQGYVLYGNHTQPTGDVLMPYYLGDYHWFNVLASPANLGIPVIGPLTCLGGALPTPQSLRQMRVFNSTVTEKLRAGEWVVIYPEEHVWPYYTGIRPFNFSAFHFPIAAHVPAYCLTTTYRKRWWCRRPKRIAYVDGPFEPDRSLSAKQQQHQLANQIQACMTKRTAMSNATYIDYEEE